MTFFYNGLCRSFNLATEPGIQTHCLSLSRFLNAHLKDEDYHNFRIKQNRFFKINDFHTNFLSKQELLTVNTFKSLKKQIEWMAGRFLVKKLMCAALGDGIKATDISIEYHGKGAPFIQGFPGFKVSISHSGDYAAAAILNAKETDIGLDIEKIRKMPEDSFMKLAFTTKEITAMKPGEIFKIWTIKEAFLKYIKMGFHESLHAVEVIDNRILYNGNPTDVTITTGNLEKSYAVCLISGPALM